MKTSNVKQNMSLVEILKYQLR